MSDNVSTSVRTDAERCVSLPENLLSEQLVMFFLFFRQWTGEVTATRSDLSAGIIEGQLPPDEITASYGRFKVIDPQNLKRFETLKKRAETALKEVGVPFCKGYAIPTVKAKELADRLRSIAEEFNRERDTLINELPKLLHDWRQAHPEVSRVLPPDPTDIARRINADFGMTHMACVSSEIDAEQSFVKVAQNDLFGSVIKDVAKRSGDLLRKSVQGKQPDDLSQKTLGVLRSISTKLAGLRFLHSGVTPLCEVVDRLLAVMPTEGKFTHGQFLTLQASLALLSNESLLAEVANGRLTLESYLSAIPYAPGSLFATPDTTSVSTAPQAEETSVVETSNEVTTMEEPVEASPATAEETKADVPGETTAPAEVEAQEQAPEDAADDLFGELFGEVVTEINEASASDTEEEVEVIPADNDIPPSPTEFFMSSF